MEHTVESWMAIKKFKNDAAHTVQCNNDDDDNERVREQMPNNLFN